VSEYRSDGSYGSDAAEQSFARKTRCCVYCKKLVDPESSYYWHQDCKRHALQREVDLSRQRIAELEAALLAWEELWKAVNEMEGGNLRQDNKPLAVAASYALLKNHSDSALATARKDGYNEGINAAIGKIDPQFDGLIAVLRALQAAEGKESR
jgi:hypothetical protein